MDKRSGFQLANDLIWMHGYRGGTSEIFRPQSGVPSVYRSLPSAIFVLAFAAGEEMVKLACSRMELLHGRGAPMHLGSEGFVSAWREKTGEDLAARARIAPRVGVSIHRWELLEGVELGGYLRDAYRWRNHLAHNGSPDSLDQRSADQFETKYFRREVLDGDGNIHFKSPEVNLNLAEGVVQAAQDIAYLTASPGDRENWKWAVPRWSSTGKMPRKLAFDERFSLPRSLFEWASDRNAVDPEGWR